MTRISKLDCGLICLETHDNLLPLLTLYYILRAATIHGHVETNGFRSEHIGVNGLIGEYHELVNW
jgi:hypothetical protein